jgi:hypothetical protein
VGVFGMMGRSQLSCLFDCWPQFWGILNRVMA